MNNKAIILVLVIVAVAGSVYYFMGNSQDGAIQDNGEMRDPSADSGSSPQAGSGQEGDNGTTLEVPAPGYEGVDEMIVNEDGMTEVEFSGEVLGGSSSPVINFNQADYEKALESEKLVVLYFYANWCPTCKKEIPKMYSAFSKLTGDDVVGFRVNYNDNETDSKEKDLAREFGVAYQHTKVFVKDGQRIGKWPDSWDEARYLKEIGDAL